MNPPPPIAAKAAGPDCLRCKVPIRERHPAFIELCMHCGGIASGAKQGKPDSTCSHHPVLTRGRGYVCQFCGVAVAIVPVGVMEGVREALRIAMTAPCRSHSNENWRLIAQVAQAAAALEAKADAGVK
jgi:protein-disulfide isomerase-like protein with CxxC motif